MDRQWQARKVKAGDYLLFSNDLAVLWRFRRYDERDGTLTRNDGTVVHGTFWALLRYTKRPLDLNPDDLDSCWNEDVWAYVQGLLPTRQAAIDEAMRLDAARHDDS